MALNKSYSREFETSPSFQWSNGDQIAIGTSLNMSWESYNATSQKYLPFNFTRIVNNGESDITFYPNQDVNKAILIPKGTIITMDRTSVPALSSFRITNSGAAIISASKIFINNTREGVTSQSVVERLHSRLFNRANGGV